MEGKNHNAKRLSGTMNETFAAVSYDKINCWPESGSSSGFDIHDERKDENLKQSKYLIIQNYVYARDSFTETNFICHKLPEFDIKSSNFELIETIIDKLFIDIVETEFIKISDFKFSDLAIN